MPMYEYLCEACDGVFDLMRPMSQATEPADCPECSGRCERIMSEFSAFTMRDGYPRRIPDRGTYWHLGEEVKTMTDTLPHGQHPELIAKENKKKGTKSKLRPRSL